MTTYTVTVDQVVADHGSVIVFAGLDAKDDLEVTFAVDRRLAGPLAQAVFYADELPQVELEPWQILSRHEREAA